MSRFWDKNNYSERDQVEETFEEQAEALLDEMEEDSEDSEEEEVMEDYTPKSKSVYKLDTRESNILSDATVRLEQARLYDMLIKHDLFAGVKANPKALQNVQNELKQYIVSRLEVLLGIRQEKKEKDQPKQLVVESPFNDVEIEFLKALSYKGTKGASASAPNKKMVANEIKSLDSTYQDSSSLKPLTQQEPENLTPISEDDDDNEELARPRKTLPPKKKTVSTQRVAPKLAPTKSTQRIRRGEMSNAEAEQIALEDLKKNGSGLSKHPYEMSPKELKELVKKRSKSKEKSHERPANAVPIPTGDQLGVHYQMQQANQTMNPSNNGFNVILQKVLHDKNNK